MSAINPNCSIIVRNIAPSTNPPTKQIIIEFFVFCGNIVSLSIFEDQESISDTLAAYITFESEANAKTAVLLNTTVINGRPVSVELAPSNFKIPEDSITDGYYTRPEDQSEIRVPEQKSILTDLISAVTAQAKAIDDTLQITPKVAVGITAVSETFNTIDSQLQITTTVKTLGTGITTAVNDVDSQLQITETVKTIGTGISTTVNDVDSQLQISEKVKNLGTGITEAVQGVDTQLQITETVKSLGTGITTAVQGVDSQLQITESVKSLGTGITTAVQGVDQQLEISNKAQEVGTTVTNFLSTASATAVTGLSSAATTIDQAVGPTVQAGVTGVKTIGASIVSTFETLMSPRK